MVISIDWGTRIIYIPRADLTLVQSTPTEIRSMDLNWFRLQLKNLEDSEVGIAYPDTHRHNSEVLLGGLTYARVVELINDFTVTFEDGQYAVNLIGANSNVGDKVNVNQVSVRSSNSAGMTSSAAIEFSSYENRVTIDVNSTNYGTTYPIGTALKPVNNLQDALLIATSRGFSTLYLLSNLTILDGQNIDGYKIISNDWEIEVAIEAGASCINTVFEKLTVNGVVSGNWNVFINCWLFNVTNFCGWLIGGSFEDITLAPYNSFSLGQSYFDSVVPMYPFVDMVIRMNTATSIACTSLEGYYRIENSTNGCIAVIGIHSGTLTISNTCNGGDIEVSGIGLLLDLSEGTNVTTDGFMNKATISSAVWDEALSQHIIPGSTGKTVALSEFDNYVCINTINGIAGTIFPIGTNAYPVNNLTDAVVINNIYKFNSFNVYGEITANTNFEAVTFYAGRSFLVDIFNFGGRNYNKTRFENIRLHGTMYGNNVSFINCYIEAVKNISGEITGGMLTGDITMAPGGYLSGIDLVVDGDFTIIDLQNAPNTIVSLDVNSGIITFKNAVDTCLIELNLRGGEIVLDSSCVGGEFYAEGYGTLYNESTMTIKDNHLIALETIPPYILNSHTTDYLTNNTIGKAISDAATGGAGIDEAGVHSALDSYVNKNYYKADISTLATKTDLQSLNVPTVSAITTAVWAHSKANQISNDITFIKNIEGGRWEIVNNQMIFYSEDNTTEIARFNLYNENGVLSDESVVKRIRI